MINEKRIQEAENNVRIYLQDGLLRKQSFKKEIFIILKRNAHESLETSQFVNVNNKSDMWTIITSYYATYYIANAALYKLGYKVGTKISHKVTADALLVFVRNKLKTSLLEEFEELQKEALAGIKADSVLENFDYERKKRNLIQYETTSIEKHTKAITSLQRAKEFVFEMEKILL